MKKKENGIALPLALVFMVITQIIYLSLLNLQQTDSLQQSMLIDYYQTGVQHRLMVGLLEGLEETWLSTIQEKIVNSIEETQLELKRLYELTDIIENQSVILSQDNENQVTVMDVTFYLPDSFKKSPHLLTHPYYGGTYQLKKGQPQWTDASNWIAANHSLNQQLADIGFVKNNQSSVFNYSRSYKLSNIDLHTVHFNDGHLTLEPREDFNLTYRADHRPFNRKVIYKRPAVTVYFKVSISQYNRIN